MEAAQAVVVEGINQVHSHVLVPLIGASCANAVVTLDFEQVECFSLLLSKVLGLGIVAGSSIVKLPQIFRIRQAKSAKGISAISYVLETLAIFVGLSYSYRMAYAFSTYGDGIFVAVQNLIILALIYSYSKNYMKIVSTLVAFVAIGYALVNPTLVSIPLLSQLQIGAVILGIVSRVPQILSNAREKSTGEISVLTTIMQFAGAVARVFTTLKEVRDPVILASFVTTSFLLGVLLLQIWMYRRPSKQRSSKKRV